MSKQASTSTSTQALAQDIRALLAQVEQRAETPASVAQLVRARARMRDALAETAPPAEPAVDLVAAISAAAQAGDMALVRKLASALPARSADALATTQAPKPAPAPKAPASKPATATPAATATEPGSVKRIIRVGAAAKRLRDAGTITPAAATALNKLAKQDIGAAEAQVAALVGVPAPTPVAPAAAPAPVAEAPKVVVNAALADLA